MTIIIWDHRAGLLGADKKSTQSDLVRRVTKIRRIRDHLCAAAEREAIAKSLDKQADLACDEIDRQWAQEMAAAVRARGNTYIHSQEKSK